MIDRIPDEIKIADEGILVDGEPFPFFVVEDTIEINIERPGGTPTVRLTLFARNVSVQGKSSRRVALASERAHAFHDRQKVG